MKNYINEFIEDLKLAGRSEGTLREYRARLIEIADYFSENNIKIEEVTNADIKGFLNFLLKKNQKISKTEPSHAKSENCSCFKKIQSSQNASNSGE